LRIGGVKGGYTFLSRATERILRLKKKTEGTVERPGKHRGKEKRTSIGGRGASTKG